MSSEPLPVCSHCKSFFGSLARRHQVEACPLKRGSYCGLCATYGHSPAECPDVALDPFREPQFVEQLVPSSLLEMWGIESRTPLSSAATISAAAAAAVTQKEYYMEVPETDEALRAALTAAGVKPMICQEKGKKRKTELQENKRRLQKVAEAHGRKLIFVSPGKVLGDFEGELGEAPVAEAVAKAEEGQKKTAPISKEDGGEQKKQGKKAGTSKSKKAAAAAPASNAA